tara:strand:+ start:160 stop:375 length:216 start_codon:yes stop_codon:yes gene_type:complete
MGKGIIYNNPSGDKALENVYKLLKKNPKALDASGMGPSQRVETLHLPQAKANKKKNTKNLPTSYKGTTATG